jgi:hypothetical protein
MSKTNVNDIGKITALLNKKFDVMEKQIEYSGIEKECIAKNDFIVMDASQIMGIQPKSDVFKTI